MTGKPNTHTHNVFSTTDFSSSILEKLERKGLWLTLVQYKSKLHGATNMQMLSINILENWGKVCDNLKKFFNELHSLEILKKVKKMLSMS